MTKSYPFFYIVLATNVGIMAALGFEYYRGKPLTNIVLCGVLFLVIVNLLLYIKKRQDHATRNSST